MRIFVLYLLKLLQLLGLMRNVPGLTNERGAENWLKSLELRFGIPPLPDRVSDRERPFLMEVGDVFAIKGLGTVVTGFIERGVIKPEDKIEIVGHGETRASVVTRVEMGREPLPEAGPGDNVGCVLASGVEKRDLQRGQVLATPGSIRAHKRFVGEVYMLNAREHGLPAPAITSDTELQFYFHSTDVNGTFELPAGMQRAERGTSVQMTIALESAVAMEQHMRFGIREQYRQVGLGVVLEVLE